MVYLEDNCIQICHLGEVNRRFYSRKFRFTTTRQMKNAFIPIQMHIFIFLLNKMYYLHKKGQVLCGA